MPKIEIDEEVMAFLKAQARPFVETTPNAVLRRLLLGKPISRRMKSEAARPKRVQDGGVDTGTFVDRVLERRFGHGFRKRPPYQYMFDSEPWRVYFQNFNKKETSNLWYRLRGGALRDLDSAKKDAAVCLTNPAQGIVYVLPVAEVIRRARRAGWAGGDLEVNIDPSDNRWRELDWDLSTHLERYDF